MNRRRMQGGVALAACALCLGACGISKESNAMTNQGPSASRLPPPDVAPVSIDGVRYAQRAGKEAVDGQVGGLLGAYDSAGTLLWTLKVYDNRRRPDLEGDVQDVYFKSLAVEPDGRLRIVNEVGDAFIVDVNTREVTALPKAKPADPGGLRPTKRP
jgi:hypothetical protein